MIVIDTSESTAGALVKAFLRETFGILRTSGRFFDRCNVAVMQCDDAVRELTFLHSAEEWERYAAALTLHGGGGTDFRPAFARIAELQREGTLRELQGILYFTDGKGTYRARPPACQTAFLFVEDGAEPPPSPPWGDTADAFGAGVSAAARPPRPPSTGRNGTPRNCRNCKNAAWRQQGEGPWTSNAPNRRSKTPSGPTWPPTTPARR